MNNESPLLSLSLSDLNSPFLDKKLLEINECKFFVDVEFADGRKIVHAKDLIISYYLWDVLRIVNLSPMQEDMIYITKLNNDVLIDKLTELYNKALDHYPDFDISTLITGPWNSMNWIFNLSFGEREVYVQSADALDIFLMNQQPELRKLADMTFPDEQGTDVAEMRLEKAMVELIELLGTRGKLKFNPMIDFMECGILNPRQMVQLHVGYGPRADVTDQLAKHIISESTLSGLKTADDFAIESLSAKKSKLYSRTVIEDTQYFNRKERLCTNGIRYIYKGDCGNRLSIPFILSSKLSVLKNMFGKRFFFEGKEYSLSKENVKEFAGKRVEIVSPITCFHTDGVCEHCMGLASRHVKAFFSPNIHIGNLAAAFFSGSVSQMVLSAKHLIKTATKLYFMNSAAGTYFACKGTGIYLHPKLINRGYSDCAFKFVASDFLGQLTDLHLDGIDILPEASIFSKISGVQFCIKQGGQWKPLEIFSLNNEGLCPFLASSFLNHIRTVYNDIVIDEEEDSVLIPLTGFDWKTPILKYLAINDDMIAFSKRLIDFFGKKITAHTSISGCLQELAAILYQKSKLPFLDMEIVLKAFIMGQITKETVSGMCNDIIFGSTDQVLGDRSISNKFSYQYVNTFLNDPEVYTEKRPYGYYDAFFNFGPPENVEPVLST